MNTKDNNIYWHTESDIPNNIIEYIKQQPILRVYEKETNKYYCTNCLKEMENENECKYCNLKYRALDFQRDTISVGHNTISNHSNSTFFFYNYYVFNVIEKNVVLYNIKAEFRYINLLSLFSNKSSLPNETNIIPEREWRFSIAKTYLIQQTGITDIGEKNKFYDFKELDKYIVAYDKLCSGTALYEEEFESLRLNLNVTNMNKEELDFFFSDTHSFLYTENLSDLKSTIYKDTHIWRMKDYIEPKRLSIAQFTLFPLYYQEFAFATKYQLYNLALNYPFSLKIKKGDCFEQIFGIEEKYLPFMIENDCDRSLLLALQKNPTDDIAMIDFLVNDEEYDSLRFINEYNLDLTIERIKDYFDKNNIDYNLLYLYIEYLSFARLLGMDLKSEEVLFPTDLEEANCRLYDLLHPEQVTTNE